MYEVIADGMSEADARALLIEVAGIKMRKDLKLHMRWEIYYPSQKVPRWCTKTIRDVGDQAALCICMKEIWVWHTELNPKQQCPHSFD